jgi:hypothetical protein
MRAGRSDSVALREAGATGVVGSNRKERVSRELRKIVENKNSR